MKSTAIVVKSLINAHQQQNGYYCSNHVTVFNLKSYMYLSTLCVMIACCSATYNIYIVDNVIIAKLAS